MLAPISFVYFLTSVCECLSVCLYWGKWVISPEMHVLATPTCYCMSFYSNAPIVMYFAILCLCVCVYIIINLFLSPQLWPWEANVIELFTSMYHKSYWLKVSKVGTSLDVWPVQQYLNWLLICWNTVSRKPLNCNGIDKHQTYPDLTLILTLTPTSTQLLTLSTKWLLYCRTLRYLLLQTRVPVPNCAACFRVGRWHEF